MKNGNGIGERIKKIRGELSQGEFASRISVHKQTVLRWEKGETKPDSDALRKICETFNINPSWLLFGERPMYRGEKVAETTKKPRKTPEIPEEVLDVEEYVFLPLLESRVTAGPDGEIFYEGVEDYYPFKRWWIEKLVGRSPERQKCLVLFRVRGDSMSPTINPGEVVLVDTSESERLNIRNGKIYLVRQPDGGLSIKRLFLSEKEEKLRLVYFSDNPNYEPFEVEVDPDRGLKYYVLGRIRWVGREVD